MKYLCFLFGTILLLTSCRNNEDEVFEMRFELDVVYEAGLSQFEAHFIDSYNIATRIEDLLAASGRSREDITAILPKSAEIVNQQSDISLDFVRNIIVESFDGSILNPDIKENETEIFFRDPVPVERTTFIQLLPSLPDVKEQLLEDSFNISLRSELRAPPPSTIEARLILRFTAQ